jgi:hypothetical protein
MISTEEATPGSVKVTWSPAPAPEDQPRLTGYQIFFRKARHTSSPQNVKVVHVDGEQTSFVIHNLTCGSSYLVYAKAVNEIGVSERSVSSHVQLQGNLPLTPDGESGLVLNGSDTVLLLSTWLPRGCPIHHFSVAYKLFGSQDWIIGKRVSSILTSPN